jgi:hypothetical protein
MPVLETVAAFVLYLRSRAQIADWESRIAVVFQLGVQQWVGARNADLPPASAAAIDSSASEEGQGQGPEDSHRQQGHGTGRPSSVTRQAGRATRAKYVARPACGLSCPRLLALLVVFIVRGALLGACCAASLCCCTPDSCLCTHAVPVTYACAVRLRSFPSGPTGFCSGRHVPRRPITA